MTVLKVNQMAELRKQVDSHGGDFLRNLVRETVQQFMAAEVDALCGASHGSRSSDRVKSRNGVRHRPWDTRTGTIDLEIPKEATNPRCLESAKSSTYGWKNSEIAAWMRRRTAICG